jgi:hypothetical protein
MLKHNNEMTCQGMTTSLSVLKMLIVQTMHSRSYGGKMKNSILFTMDWSDQLLVLVFVSHKRCCLCNDVRPTEKDLPSYTRFNSPQLHYINGVFYAKICHEVGPVDVVEC